jgi:hypothetical protein
LIRVMKTVKENKEWKRFMSIHPSTSFVWCRLFLWSPLRPECLFPARRIPGCLCSPMSVHSGPEGCGKEVREEIRERSVCVTLHSTCFFIFVSCESSAHSDIYPILLEVLVLRLGYKRYRISNWSGKGSMKTIQCALHLLSPEISLMYFEYPSVLLALIIFPSYCALFGHLNFWRLHLNLLLRFQFGNFLLKPHLLRNEGTPSFAKTEEFIWGWRFLLFLNDLYR